MPRPGQRTDPGPARAAGGGDLGWALGVVFRAYVKSSSAVLHDLPGGPRGHQVLAAAVEATPESQISLARRLGIDKTVMTYLIDDLERAGLLERRANPDDRRHKTIVATDHGHQVWSATRERLEQAEEHLLGSLRPTDREALRSLLFQLADQAQAVDPVVDTCQIVSDIAADSQPHEPADSQPHEPADGQPH
ncbi:MarR family winged helix-turn-helix transcriptional regulator [Solwaraspora sp. WMMA2065]|uniref:MarR family winged helix-turn-helix transcriptional regulator n=1 Tax=Solwaraspora sp. WMMA2065 TaxID=3015166 RepID=UPI00259B6A0D|nr:MarR family winged helix-turn-helix transcriptional regulator [Solwaraspora sp. WMMA2065]WJK33770.1 MarR family winged helix-turn-helix transcriptional regulator [Solwaraspora sp. WMMA2065]